MSMDYQFKKTDKKELSSINELSKACNERVKNPFFYYIYFNNRYALSIFTYNIQHHKTPHTPLTQNNNSKFKSSTKPDKWGKIKKNKTA